MPRRGQSSVEPLLAFSVVFVLALSVCWWQFDTLMVWVNEASIAFQASTLFDDIAKRLGGS